MRAAIGVARAPQCGGAIARDVSTTMYMDLLKHYHGMFARYEEVFHT